MREKVNEAGERKGESVNEKELYNLRQRLRDINIERNREKN